MLSHQLQQDALLYSITLPQVTCPSYSVTRSVGYTFSRSATETFATSTTNAMGLAVGVYLETTVSIPFVADVTAGVSLDVNYEFSITVSEEYSYSTVFEHATMEERTISFAGQASAILAAAFECCSASRSSMLVGRLPK